MITKWVKRGLVGLAVALVVGSVLFGKDLSSYIRSSAKMTQDKVKDAVPVEFELRSSRICWKRYCRKYMQISN